MCRWTLCSLWAEHLCQPLVRVQRYPYLRGVQWVHPVGGGLCSLLQVSLASCTLHEFFVLIRNTIVCLVCMYVCLCVCMKWTLMIEVGIDKLCYSSPHSPGKYLQSHALHWTCLKLWVLALTHHFISRIILVTSFSSAFWSHLIPSACAWHPCSHPAPHSTFNFCSSLLPVSPPFSFSYIYFTSYVSFPPLITTGSSSWNNSFLPRDAIYLPALANAQEQLHTSRSVSHSFCWLTSLPLLTSSQSSSPHFLLLSLSLHRSCIAVWLCLWAWR